VCRSRDRRGRPVTMVFSGAGGDPCVKLGALQSATIQPRALGGWSVWTLRLVFREARRRKSNSLDRDFPAECVLLAWGHHPDAFVEDLPQSETAGPWRG